MNGSRRSTWVDERARRTKRGNSATAMAMTALLKLGPSAAATMTPSSSDGNDINRSAKRDSSRSVQPPKYPARMPVHTPAIAASVGATMPIESDTRAPITRGRTRRGRTRRCRTGTRRTALARDKEVLVQRIMRHDVGCDQRDDDQQHAQHDTDRGQLVGRGVGQRVAWRSNGSAASLMVRTSS